MEVGNSWNRCISKEEKEKKQQFFCDYKNNELKFPSHKFGEKSDDLERDYQRLDLDARSKFPESVNIDSACQ